MAEQKRKARAGWSGSGEKSSDAIWFDIAEEGGSTEFTGYVSDKAEAQVIALVKDGKRGDSAGAGDMVDIIVNQTPIYGESGGQMADAGTISGDNGLKAAVRETAKPFGRVHAQRDAIEAGTSKGGDRVKERKRTMLNTSTESA